MEEKKLSIVLEALAETIERLRLELHLANSRNNMLEDENRMLNEEIVNLYKKLEAKEKNKNA